MKLFERLIRKKVISKQEVSSLSKCLGLVAVFCFNLGSLYGGDVWIVTGSIVKNYGSSGAFIAYLISGLTVVINSLCYAELACKIPKAGGTYIYTYVIIGEVWALIVGWLELLGLLYSNAYLYTAIEESADYLMSGAYSTLMHNLFSSWPRDSMIIKAFPDLLSMVLALIVMCVATIGVDLSTSINNVISFLNITITLTITCFAFTKANPENWSSGVLPQSTMGMFRASAIAFFAYAWFDGFTEIAEETKSPERTIPRAVTLSVLAGIFMFCTPTIALTLMAPWQSIRTEDSFQYAFDSVGAKWASYVVSAAIIVSGLNNSLCITMAASRLVYAMSSDKTVAHCLSKVNKLTKTPLRATFLCGLVTSLMALTLRMSHIVNVNSLLVNLVCTMAPILVTLTRYQPTTVYSLHQDTLPQNQDPKTSGKHVPLLLSVTIASMFVFFLSLWYVKLVALQITFAVAAGVLILVLYGFLLRRPTYSHSKQFHLPLVPTLPLICVFINVAMVVTIPGTGWLECLVWVAGGLALYFVYVVIQQATSSDCDSTNEEALVLEHQAANTDREESQYGSMAVK